MSFIYLTRLLLLLPPLMLLLCLPSDAARFEVCEVGIAEESSYWWWWWRWADEDPPPPPPPIQEGRSRCLRGRRWRPPPPPENMMVSSFSFLSDDDDDLRFPAHDPKVAPSPPFGFFHHHFCFCSSFWAVAAVISFSPPLTTSAFSLLLPATSKPKLSGREARKLPKKHFHWIIARQMSIFNIFIWGRKELSGKFGTGRREDFAPPFALLCPANVRAARRVAVKVLP